MPVAFSPVLGTIQIEPLLDEAGCVPGVTDDSTLGLVLEEFAHRERLVDSDSPIRLIASARLSRFGIGPDQSEAQVWADLARLLDDLQAEYDELGLRCA